jgi:hypothetical protein
MKLRDIEARSFSRVASSTLAQRNVARRMSAMSGFDHRRITFSMMLCPRVARGALVAALTDSNNSGGGVVAASSNASFDAK